MTTLPIKQVRLPACLKGQPNGKLPDALLFTTPGQAGGPPVRLVEPATRAWRALTAAALAAGHVLKATSAVDSYRPYSVQERIFRERYTTNKLAGRPWKKWNSVTWWQRPSTAIAAVPGHSNHGIGLAVDTGEEKDGDSGTERLDAATLEWLLGNADRFGFSWEVPSEPWHLRYYTGDAIPAAVLAYEQGATPVPQPQEDDAMPITPDWVRPKSGRWPVVDLVDVTDTGCTVLAAPPIAFSEGIDDDKPGKPKMRFIPAVHGNSALRVEGLRGRPRLARAGDGSIMLVVDRFLDTHIILPKP